MARKINLKGLYNTGKITVDLHPSTTEYVGSEGPLALFDGIKQNSFALEINDSFVDIFTINFSTPLAANKIRLKTNTRLTNDYNIRINEDVNTDVSYSVNNNTVIEESVFDINVNSLSSIRFSFLTSLVSSRHEINEIELYILDEADPYEFNDSVLSTKGWNSSRYDGRQLQGSTINEYNSGDISYGNTPIIRNNNRSFYLATEIVSLSNSGSSAEDLSLQYIPNFSYIIIDKIITVNEDDTISQLSVNSIQNNTEGENSLIGIKREFQTNIPIGSQVGLVNFDESVKNRSNRDYTVFFNRGRLQKLLRFEGNSGIFTYTRPAFLPSTLNLYTGLQTTVQGSFKSLNTKLLQEFYTGSVDAFERGGLTDTSSLQSFFNQLIEYKNNTGTKYFVTVLNTSGSNFLTDDGTEPIRTIDIDAFVVSPTKNLAEISTSEILGYGGGSVVDLDVKFPLNRSYVPSLSQGPQYSGSYDISALNEEKLSLLINMNKESELPQGKGSKPIVVIPENLHPFIKDNLVHFCAKAGLDIGDRKVVPALNESRRNLK